LHRCVIFDMDGVVSDSEPLHHVAERQLMVPYGVHLSQEQLESHTGMGLTTMLERFRCEFRLDVPIHTLATQHNQNLVNLFREQVEPIPHALDLIRDLYRSNLALAVGSSSNRGLIELVLEKFEILHYFKAVVSGQDVPKGKPNPDIFLEIAGRLHLDPSACVVIEDSRNGVTAAKTAGMACIGFRSPNSPRQDLSAADWIVHDLSEISIKTIEEELNAS
jgi:HAD superfamily hydrolase (TIGR01509 family)